MAESSRSSHAACGDEGEKSTSVFMLTTRIDPNVTANQSASGPARGVGYKRVAGTPHSPPLSFPPYRSATRSLGQDDSGESISWLPMLLTNGTRDAHGSMSADQSSHTDAYPVA